MCGRRERDKLYGPQEYGDMNLGLVEEIAAQVPEGISVQLHNNGEPLLYPQFGTAVHYFRNHVTNIVTNGKLLVEKSAQIIEHLDTLSVSIFEGDTERDEQFEILKEFLKIKGAHKPFVTARLIGAVNNKPYEELGLQVIRRTLHLPRGSVGYRREPTIPEVGYCWDLATRLAIDYKGDVSVCVRFDPERELVLGNLYDLDTTLDELWNCDKRKRMLEAHIRGERKNVPYCGDKCEYWGIATNA